MEITTKDVYKDCEPDLDEYDTSEALLSYWAPDLISLQRPIRIRSSLGPSLQFPGWYKYRTVASPNFFSLRKTDLELLTEDLCSTSFFFMASLGFIPVALVSSSLNAATTWGSLCAHSLFRSLGESSSFQYWYPKRRSAKVLLNLSTMLWPLWYSTSALP